jgi:autotransporter-associated beta strand protein
MSRFSISFGVVTVLSAAAPATAQNAWTWSGGTSGSWSTAGNWNPASVPTSGSDTVLTFGAAPNTNMTATNLSLNRMNFSAGGPAYSLGNGLNTLTFLNSSTATGPEIVLDTDSAVTFTTAVQLTNNLTVAGSGAGTLSLSGVTGSGSPSPSLTMAAAGTLKLGSAINTYGDTFVSSGTLLLTNGTAIPTTHNLTVSGGTFNTGGLSNGSGTSLGSISVSGTGKFLVPSGTSNYYMNQLQMTGGTLDATGADSFTLHITYGAGITINAGTSNWNGGNGRVVNDTGSPTPIAINPSGTLNAGFALSNAGGNPNFAFNGAGGGTVRLSNPGNTANITATNFCFLYSNDLSTNLGGGAFGTLGTGTVTLNVAYLAYDGPTATSAKPLTIAGGSAAILLAGGDLTMSGVIGESGSGNNLNVYGYPSSATLTLSANNTYSGWTFVDDNAVLAVPTIGSAGAGGASSPLGASSNAAGNLRLGSSARGTLVLIGTGAYSTDRGLTVSGLYSSGAGGAIGVANGATTLSWGGQITSAANTGSFIKTGAGTLVLYSPSNNYAGGTYIEAGTLRLGVGGGEFPMNGTLPPVGLVNLISGTLDLNGLNQSIGPLTGAAGTMVLTGGATLTTASDTNTTFAGNILGGSLIKTGAGALALSGLGNTANLTTVGTSAIYVSDMATNGVGALGTGMLTLQGSGEAGGGLAYTGPTATSSKNVTLAALSVIQVQTPGANLTLNGIISQSGAGQGLIVTGPFNDPSGTPSTLTLTGNNTYKGKTEIYGNAILAIPTIGNGSLPGPLGASTNAPANLQLGSGSSIGALVLTGSNASYSTDRGITLVSQGNIGVQNAGTTLTISGQITGPSYLYKTGAGTLVLANPNAFNSSANNYASGTYVSAGRLILGTSLAIPPASNMAVFSGAEFNTGGLTPGGGGALGTVSLYGGTFRIPEVNVFTQYYITQLVMNGGTLDGTGTTSQGGLTLNQPGVAIAVNANSAWTGPNNFFVRNDSGTELPITIAPGVTLTSSASLAGSASSFSPFRLAGGGTLYLTNAPFYGGVFLTVSQSRLRMNDLSTVSTGSFSVTLDNGTLQYAGPTASADSFALSVNGGTLEIVNSATTVTLTGAVAGTPLSPLTKSGPGTLILANAGNNFGGGLSITAGTVQTANDNTLGQGPITVAAAGTMLYTASTTSDRTFNLNFGTLAVASGATLTLNGAAVNGGFLRGTGTFAVTGGTQLAGASTSNSTVMTVTGGATFLNFSHSGAMSITAGAANPPSFSGFINQGSASITVGATSQLNVTDFQSYGTLTVSPATVSQDFSQTTLVTNVGTSPLALNGGSRTFIGTPATAVFPSNWSNVSQRGLPTFVAGLDLHGQNAIVASGLFVNNGYVEDSTNNFQGTATVVADFGALVKGAGYFQNSVQTINGGKFQAGNSPGKATFGSFVLGPGGVSNYVFAIDDGTGAAGPSPDELGHVSGWGLVKVGALRIGDREPSNGSFVWTATPADKLTVALETLLNPTTVGTDIPGPMDHFDPSLPYKWPAVEWTGSYTGPTDAATLDSATAFDTGGFANPFAGTIGWSLDEGGHTLSLTYTPTAVPEPSGFALATLAVAGLAIRRQVRSRPSARVGTRS